MAEEHPTHDPLTPPDEAGPFTDEGPLDDLLQDLDDADPTAAEKPAFPDEGSNEERGTPSTIDQLIDLARHKVGSENSLNEFVSSKQVAGIRAHTNRDGHSGPLPISRGMPLSVSYGTF